MPRIVVTAEDGTVYWTETVTPEAFESEHFRRCLLERLAWAAEDAAGAGGARAATLRPPALAA